MSDINDTPSEMPSWLFSFGTSNVRARQNRKGQLTFIFDAKNTSKITAFSDRPERLTGQMSMKKLANGFDNIFFDSRPNASLTHWDDDGFHNHIYEIKSINRRKNGTYSMKTNLLESALSENFADDQIVCSKGDKCIEPHVIEEANFFIDSITWGCNMAQAAMYVAWPPFMIAACLKDGDKPTLNDHISQGIQDAVGNTLVTTCKANSKGECIDT